MFTIRDTEFGEPLTDGDGITMTWSTEGGAKAFIESKQGRAAIGDVEVEIVED